MGPFIMKNDNLSNSSNSSNSSIAEFDKYLPIGKLLSYLAYFLEL